MPLPPFDLPFSKQEHNQWSQVTKLYQIFLMFCVAYGQGRIHDVG